VVTPVVQDILPLGSPNRPATKLPAVGPLFIVVHETGNSSPGADAPFHIRFLRSAEARQNLVSYHFSVDDRVIVQGLPLDEIGFHAGDGCDNPTTDIGCFRSIGIEGCINAGADEAKMRRNYAELIARIAAGDTAFDWGSGLSRGRFDINQLKQHIEVSDPGPHQHHCPDHMLREGFFPEFRRMVARAAGDIDLFATPHPVVPLDGLDKTIGGHLFHAVERTVECGRDECPRRQFAEVDARPVGEPLRRGQRVQVAYWVENAEVEGDDRWWVTPSGARIAVAHTTEKPE
jgi:hypothetical protein